MLNTGVEPDVQTPDNAAEVTSVDDIDFKSENAATCLTLEQLESHPELVEDSYRFDSVSITGPTIASYRGLSIPELLNLADQGDSAAMAVLGAASLMRARGQPETKAVSYLLFEDPELLSYTFKRPFAADYLAHMEQAREWFYEAALHGRVLALFHVGESLWNVKGGPVQLGWIQEEDYDSLTPYQKNALLPANVYNALAYDIAPELSNGPHGAILSELILRSERQLNVLGRLKTGFLQDLDAAGLPPIIVRESTAPPMDQLMSLLCKSEKERLAKEYSD